MECKNCNTSQQTDFNYCPLCGAKVIRNRLTFKNLRLDFTDRYFNIDNTFLRTFVHLFSKPEAVIDDYVSGIRKKYLNPISYLGIALTLSGILVFLLRKVFSLKIDLDIYDQGMSPELSQKLTQIMFDYSSLFFLLYVPIFALAGWLTFNKKEYFFSEYIVVFMYVLAHWSILSFPISLGILIVSPGDYMSLGIPLLLFMVAYSIYTMQRLHRFSTAQFFLRTGLFIILSLMGYIGLVILLYIILFLTGTITLEDFKPLK